MLAGIGYALATGVAGSLTACNIAVVSAIAPLAGQPSSQRGPLVQMLRPMAWLAAGAVAVSAVYGGIAGATGSGMPQFGLGNSAGSPLSGRMIQAMVTFGLIGAVRTWLGPASLGFVRDPPARLAARHPQAPLLLIGAMIGAFLVGRPFPLCRQLFHHAAQSGNILYGAQLSACRRSATCGSCRCSTCWSSR